MEEEENGGMVETTDRLAQRLGVDIGKMRWLLLVVMQVAGRIQGGDVATSV